MNSMPCMRINNILGMSTIDIVRTWVYFLSQLEEWQPNDETMKESMETETFVVE